MKYYYWKNGLKKTWLCFAYPFPRSFFFLLISHSFYFLFQSVHQAGKERMKYLVFFQVLLILLTTAIKNEASVPVQESYIVGLAELPGNKLVYKFWLLNQGFGLRNLIQLFTIFILSSKCCFFTLNSACNLSSSFLISILQNNNVLLI